MDIETASINDILSELSKTNDATSTMTHHMNKIGVISIDQRIKRKANRMLKQHSKETQSVESSLVQVRSWKNSRKPRNGKRGPPKKGGGGKGIWSRLGSESDVEFEKMDKNDPNYDSDNADSDIELKSIIPDMPEEELKKNVQMIVLEYYEHWDCEDALLSLDDLNCSSNKYMIPYQIMEIALEHKPSHRELTSILLSELTGRVVKQYELIQAFYTLLENLPDLMLDTPDAPHVLGNFIARCYADACIPAKAINILKTKAVNEPAKDAMSRVETLTSQAALYRLDNVWGIGGGQRPVRTLLKQIILLLEEYVSSNDIQQATRSLLDLEVPHFHHELVYESIIMVLESLKPEMDGIMCKFLKSLSDAVIITPDMITRGFFRVFQDMKDIILDIPFAYTNLERFTDACHKAGFLPEDVMKKVPLRGRKRFVSEGDGGRVKEHY